MASFPSLHAHLRLLLVISLLGALVAVVTFWSTREHASAAPDKGVVTPDAGTITVNSNADVANSSDGLCTLREAITAAETNTASGATAGECAAGSSSGSDTIDLLGVTGAINLTGALPDITSNLTIIGPGSSSLTVRRNTGGDYRLFNVSAGTVGISGLTVTNGKAIDGTSGSAAGYGGGILNTGTLTLTDVTVTGNSSGNGGTWVIAPAGGHGGGIANQAGSLTMTNCTVSSNTTGNGGPSAGSAQTGGRGGGVYNASTLTMTNCVVNGNTTGNGFGNESGGFGGGIFGAQGVLTLTNDTISNNVTGNSPGNASGGHGGGIFTLSGSTATIINSTISGNSTGVGGSGDHGYAGGINNECPTTIIGSTVSGNTGTAGGILNRNVLVMTNSTVSGNHDFSSSGPGISSSDGSSVLKLTNCTISRNDGLGVAGGNSITIRNSIIGGNSGGSDVSGPFSSQGHNLIGKANGSSGFTNGLNGDQVGSVAVPLDPGLVALADNGGPTLTHALLSTSSALDAGDACVTQAAHCSDANIPQLTTDQRGTPFNRMVDGPDGDTIATVDIGAYETQAALADISDAVTNEDTSSLVVFDAGDPSLITSVTATSDNPTLVPNDVAHVSVVLHGSTGIVTINPVANQAGAANIMLTVNHSVGGSDVKTFMLTVNPVNDVPSFTKGPDQSTNEDAGGQAVNNWAINILSGPADESGQVLNFQVTGNSNPGLFAVAPAISATGTLTYTAAANANGSTTITIALKDDGGTANGGVDTSAAQTFTITVSPVNDVPSFVKGPDQTVNEDSGSQLFSPWATNISAGPGDESGQALTFQVTNNTNAALFSSGPAISSTGALSFTPAANANGSAAITIVLKDNGGTANGGTDTSASQTFTITVNAVNDPPSFTKGANQTVNEDAGGQTVANWATSILAGPTDESGQSLAFQVTGNSNTALFSSAPAISSAGTLTYTSAADVNGSATITINLKDNGGTTNGGVDTSASQTFTITVNSVNDAPSFTKGANQTVNEDAGAQTAANWATGISPGPNETGQTVSFTATNDNNVLFSAQPALSSAGTLTYTPAANANGTTTVTITLKDNGGTSNGGADTSAPQTFTITVNAVNDAPSFTKGADQFASNNTGAQLVGSWARNISAGPANESSQTLTFQITNNTNAGLFSVAPAIDSAGTLTYTPVATAVGVATITIVLNDSGGTANGGVNTSPPQSFNITVSSSSGSVSFSSTTYSTTESSGFTTITVKRTGDMSRAVMVDYATSGATGVPCSTPGAASPKCDFTSALGTVKFGIGEDTKTFTVLISQDSFVEGSEPFTVTLSNPVGGGGVLGTPSTATVTIADDVSEPATNPIDDASNYVRQQYHDFLNREPDAAGLAFWTNEINSCGSDQTCIDLKRISVSAAFFLSIEFQGTGYLVEREYKAAYGDTTGQSTFNGPHQLPVPIVRFNEFLPDTQAIGQGIVVGQPGWEAALENNKQAFAVEFVQRFRFTTAFPVFRTPAQYVDQLNANAGNVLSPQERATAIALFGSDTNITNVTARAQALRQVAEDPDLYSAEFNRAFVLMQYFGYLRRNPNDPQDPDYSGYEFWLTKLNQFNGNFVNSDMVKAFITSSEYRQRFGP